MTIDISAQIVNYDTKRYLRECLATLEASLSASRLTHEIHVLENGSSDDLSDLAREYTGRVYFHESTDNVGFGAGHNRLAAASDARLICCVNPDTVAPPAAGLERLAGRFEDARVAAVGPALLTEAGEPQRWDHGERSGLRARIANGAGHAHWRPRSEPTAVAWVSGAFLLLRRSAAAAVGGFDERYFLYKEEEDLCLHLRRAGGRVIYDPTVTVTHIGGVVAGRDEELMRTSREYYNAKNFPSARRRRLLEAIYLNVTRRW